MPSHINWFGLSPSFQRADVIICINFLRMKSTRWNRSLVRIRLDEYRDPGSSLCFVTISRNYLRKVISLPALVHLHIDNRAWWLSDGCSPNLSKSIITGTWPLQIISNKSFISRILSKSEALQAFGTNYLPSRNRCYWKHCQDSCGKVDEDC